MASGKLNLLRTTVRDRDIQMIYSRISRYVMDKIWTDLDKSEGERANKEYRIIRAWTQR